MRRTPLTRRALAAPDPNPGQGTARARALSPMEAPAPGQGRAPARARWARNLQMWQQFNDDEGFGCRVQQSRNEQCRWCDFPQTTNPRP